MGPRCLPEAQQARAEKGETSPARGWWGVLGEFPAWEVTLERRATLSARLDVVLHPIPEGADASAHPTVTRLLADQKVSALRVHGEGLDDTFVLCEEGTPRVEVGDIAFTGRALLVRREPVLRVMGVQVRDVTVGGLPVTVE